MTVYIQIGRRVPRNWARRTLHKVGGLITFQENIWQMIIMSLNKVKKKVKQSDTSLSFVMETDLEHEDINYDIQWKKITIIGTKEQELEEYTEAMGLYSQLSKVLLKGKSMGEMPSDMKRQFKTKVLSGVKLEEAYKKGYGCMSDNNLANKLLELGILTHIVWEDPQGTEENPKI